MNFYRVEAARSGDYLGVYEADSPDAVPDAVKANFSSTALDMLGINLDTLIVYDVTKHWDAMSELKSWLAIWHVSGFDVHLYGSAHGFLLEVRRTIHGDLHYPFSVLSAEQAQDVVRQLKERYFQTLQNRPPLTHAEFHGMCVAAMRHSTQPVPA